MPQLQPISVKQARITVEGLSDIFFTSISGGKYTKESVKYNDGNNGIEKTFSGMVNIEALTLGKPFDPVNDASIATFIKTARSTSKTYTITVQPVASEVAATNLGKTITYTGCTLMSYTPAKFDRDGSGLAKVEMMFEVNELPTYG